MKLLIFGGTFEGRRLAADAVAMGACCTVSVATELGAEELTGICELVVEVGRLEVPAMTELAEKADLCIDATHPYAVRASANIRQACRAAGVPLARVTRQGSELNGAVVMPDCTTAAAFLAGTEGNILLTTGAKELAAFSGLDRHRLYVRVLPMHESISLCEAAGIAHSHIIAMRGPFSQKLNEAILLQYGIDWLVTKDGGGPGGFSQKRLAADSVGARLVVICRPDDTDGCTVEEIRTQIAQLLDQEKRGKQS